jgi:hypothetical protein
LPPFDEFEAGRLTDRLRLRALLDARRNRPAANLDAWYAAAAAFSVMVDSLDDVLQEIDVNPVIVTAGACLAVDALIIGRAVKPTEQKITEFPS